MGDPVRGRGARGPRGRGALSPRMSASALVQRHRPGVGDGLSCAGQLRLRLGEPRSTAGRLVVGFPCRGVAVRAGLCGLRAVGGGAAARGGHDGVPVRLPAAALGERAWGRRPAVAANAGCFAVLFLCVRPLVARPLQEAARSEPQAEMAVANPQSFLADGPFAVRDHLRVQHRPRSRDSAARAPSTTRRPCRWPSYRSRRFS